MLTNNPKKKMIKAFLTPLLALIIFLNLLIPLILAAPGIPGKNSPKIEIYANVARESALASVYSMLKTAFYGLNKVTFYNYSKSPYKGFYWAGGFISINMAFQDYNQTLQHELAHHYCWQNFKYFGHNGTFTQCLKFV